MKISIGISTCPNDTFAFHALMTGAIRVPGLEFDFTLADVEELNRGVLADRFDVAKTSFHTALLVADRVIVLRSGSALGFGVGPVLLGRDDRPSDPKSTRIVLGPGPHTTAALLYHLFHDGPIRHVVFSEIMPALVRGEADLGVCIHEGRFTYRDHGLQLVEDLGDRWEQSTGSPIPLGGIVGRTTLGEDLLATVDDAIRRSIEFARDDPECALPTMRRYAQELEPTVVLQHVTTYVTEATLDLGSVGEEALRTLAIRAAAAGVTPPGSTLRIR